MAESYSINRYNLCYPLEDPYKPTPSNPGNRFFIPSTHSFHLPLHPWTLSTHLFTMIASNVLAIALAAAGAVAAPLAKRSSGQATYYAAGLGKYSLRSYAHALSASATYIR